MKKGKEGSLKEQSTERQVFEGQRGPIEKKGGGTTNVLSGLFSH